MLNAGNLLASLDLQAVLVAWAVEQMCINSFLYKNGFNPFFLIVQELFKSALTASFLIRKYTYA